MLSSALAITKNPVTDLDPRVQLLAAVALNRILRYPLDRASIVDQCGSIALVHFVPCEPAPGTLDPVAPVVLGSLGDRFDDLMNQYYCYLMRWSPSFSIEAHRSWGHNMGELVETIVRAADILRARGKGSLSHEEWDYFKVAVEACSIFPGTGLKMVEEGW